MNVRPGTYTSAKPAYLTPEAFGQHFVISRMTVYRLLHDGKVRSIRFGRAFRIPVAEVARFARDAEMWGEE